MLGKIHSIVYAGAGTATLPGGRYLRVIAADGPLTLTFYDESGQPIGEWVGVLGGFAIDAEKFSAKSGQLVSVFGRVGVYSATAQTVEVAVSKVPVYFDRVTGTVSAVLTSGGTITDAGSTTATTAATALIAAGSGRKSVRFHNNGANIVALGGSGVTFADGVIFIAPGETWIESDGANGAWYGITSAGTSGVSVQAIG